MTASSAPRPFFATVPADVRRVEAEAFFQVPASATHPFAAPMDEVVDGRYTRGELEAAFAAIQDQGNWKNPIGPVAVPVAFVPVAAAAAIFFAGCVLAVEAVTADRWAVVAAPGYYASVGA